MTNARSIRARLPANTEIRQPLDALVGRIEAELSDQQLAGDFGVTFDAAAADRRLRQRVTEVHELAHRNGLCPYCLRP